jgi:hypothetical protein
MTTPHDRSDFWPEPPWGRRMRRRDRTGIHDRWIGRLRQKLPEGVPQDANTRESWPATFGDKDADGRAMHKPHGGDYTFQCGGCRFYICIEGPLGADWGVCGNARSEYDRQAVFEHWTCKEFKY